MPRPAKRQPKDQGEDATKLPVRTKDGKPAAAASGSATKAPANLTVFDDDDDEDDEAPGSVKPPVPASRPAAAPVSQGDDEDESDSDDDGAPEAISTSEAASKLKKSAQAAQKASQEQAAVQKRKRQERDALFKQQAEERKKAVQEASASASAQGPAGDNDAVTGTRRRSDRLQIPTILPDEFLTDSSSDDDDDDADERQRGLEAAAGPKRRKVASVERTLTRLDRGPRDEAVGSTVYRVASKNDQRLAPKSKKYAKGAKEALLKRNRTAVASGGGFFRK